MKRDPRKKSGQLAKNEALSPAGTHADLAVAARSLAKRIEEPPQVASLFMINPVRAMADLGYPLTDHMALHVRDVVPEVFTRDAKLYDRVRLGKRALPWVTRVAFVQRRRNRPDGQ